MAQHVRVHARQPEAGVVGKPSKSPAWRARRRTTMFRSRARQYSWRRRSPRIVRRPSAKRPERPRCPCRPSAARAGRALRRGGRCPPRRLRSSYPGVGDWEVGAARRSDSAWRRVSARYRGRYPATASAADRPPDPVECGQVEFAARLLAPGWWRNCCRVGWCVVTNVGPTQEVRSSRQCRRRGGWSGEYNDWSCSRRSGSTGTRRPCRFGSLPGDIGSSTGGAGRRWRPLCRRRLRSMWRGLGRRLTRGLR